MNVEFGDSRDAHGRQRFFHEDVENDLMFQPPDRTMAYWRYKVDKKVSVTKIHLKQIPVRYLQRNFNN